MSETPDYTVMDGPTLLAALGADAWKWAKAFCQHMEKGGIAGLDEELVVTWFANAIMHSHDVMTGTGPVLMPDGSGFFIAEVAQP